MLMMIMEVIAGHLWVKVVVAAALKVVITVQEALLLCPYSLEWVEHSMTAISPHFRETNLDRRMSAALWLNSNYSLSKNRLLIEVHGALHAPLLASCGQCYHCIKLSLKHFQVVQMFGGPGSPTWMTELKC